MTTSAITPASALGAFLRADELQDIIDSFEVWRAASLSVSATQLSTNLRPYDTYCLLRDTTRHTTHHLSKFWKCMDVRLDDASPLTTLGGCAGGGSQKPVVMKPEDAMVEKEEVESNVRMVIIGAGPAGLFAAVRGCLLKPMFVGVVEKRAGFGRFNVMRIHKSEMDELCQMFGARDFYSQLAVGQYDSVPIRRIQIILLKMALILGANS
ncbi:hypothetical protein HDU67_004300 [Dinochytrium kinnereticum]|nr:hypothetical protein HDU67_004300 [Dinochytrium kinnereticum]